jgi:hypothetical protein
VAVPDVAPKGKGRPRRVEACGIAESRIARWFIEIETERDVAARRFTARQPRSCTDRIVTLVSLKALAALKSLARARWAAKGTRHAHEIPDFVDPYARDGHRFESPQLHQEVGANRPGFPVAHNPLVR